MRRLSEFTWEDVTGDGQTWELADDTGQRVAEVFSQLDEVTWTYTLHLPERFWANGNPVAGRSRTLDGAKRIVESILADTLLLDD